MVKKLMKSYLVELDEMKKIKLYSHFVCDKNLLFLLQFVH